MFLKISFMNSCRTANFVYLIWLCKCFSVKLRRYKMKIEILLAGEIVSQEYSFVPFNVYGQVDEFTSLFIRLSNGNRSEFHGT